MLSTKPNLAQPVPLGRIGELQKDVRRGIVAAHIPSWWWLSKVPLQEGKGKSHLTEHTDPLGHSCKKQEQSPAGRELSGAVCWWLKANKWHLLLVVTPRGSSGVQ